MKKYALKQQKLDKMIAVSKVEVSTNRQIDRCAAERHEEVQESACTGAAEAGQDDSCEQSGSLHNQSNRLMCSRES